MNSNYTATASHIGRDPSIPQKTETSARAMLVRLELLADRVCGLANFAEERLNPVVNGIPPEKETDMQPQVILPPLFDEARHNMDRLEAALGRIEKLVNRVEL